MSEAKDYLNRIKWYDVLIDSKLEEMERLNDLLFPSMPSMTELRLSAATGTSSAIPLRKLWICRTKSTEKLMSLWRSNKRHLPCSRRLRGRIITKSCTCAISAI